MRTESQPLWYVAFLGVLLNLLLGLLAVVPVVFTLTALMDLAQELGLARDSPVDEGEGGVAVTVAVVGLAVLLPPFYGLNRMLRRHAATVPGLVYWVLAVVVLFVPFAAFWVWLVNR